MTHRSFVVWLFLALVTLAGATLSVLGQPGFQRAEVHDEIVFPDLRADPNVAAIMVVEDGQNTISLSRADDASWRLEQKAGYPANGKKVLELIGTLADIRFVEAKTNRAESFARLEVEDPEGEGSKSRRITVSTADGKVLADLILGKRSTQRTGPDSFGSYLRRPETEQAWLVHREVRADRKVVDWLDRDIINIKQADIATMELSPEAAESYAFSRREPNDDFVLAAESEGGPQNGEARELDQGAIKRVASAIYFLSLQDVRPRQELELPETRSVARFTTFDGLGVLAEVALVDNKDWVIFTVGFTGEEADQSEEAKAARAMAEDLNAKLSPWVYEIPRFEADRLRNALDDLYKKSDGTS